MKRNLTIGIIVFLAGAVLMALEIAGGRLLTPDYGGSVYVWGSIIGIFLIGLSSGYFFGGKIADKYPLKHTLSLLMLTSAIFTLVIPLIHKPVVKLFTILPNNISPLASSISLFLIPSILLGTVSPFAIKLSAKNITGIGNLSGNLYALATTGSVIGTFLTTFVLILILPMKVLFVSLGIILLLCSLLLSKRVLLPALIILIISTTFFIPFGESSTGLATDELLDVSKESLYGQVRVADSYKARELFISGAPMGSMDKEDPTSTLSGWEYIDSMENAFLINPEIDDVLIIGLGPGLLAKKLQQNHPETKVDGVDINPVVIEFAQKYFNVTSTENLKLIESDGRTFLENEKKYDLITIDAYHFKETYKIPFHLATKEFFESVQKNLKQDGIFTAMYISERDSYAENNFHKSEYKTVDSVFKKIYMFDCGPTQVLFASDSILDLSSDEFICEYYNIDIDTNDVPLFTDDYAPINLFEEIGEN